MGGIEDGLRDMLAERMKAAGLSPAALAAATALSRPFVGRVLKGERHASLAVWQRLYDATEPPAPPPQPTCRHGVIVGQRCPPPGCPQQIARA